MKKKKQNIFKPFLPLIIAFLGAFIFFLSYNHYLLDSSLVNLKLSLKNLKATDKLAEVKNILDDTFLMEISKESFDLASAMKLEISSQLVKAVPEEESANQKYLLDMNSALKIDLSNSMLGEGTNTAQLKDAKHFIDEVVGQKAGSKPFLVSKMEDMLIALFPQKRKVAESEVYPKIRELEKSLSSYRGEALQEKYLEIARLYLRIKDFDNSFKNVQEAIKLGPDNPAGLKGLFYSGIIYKAKGDPRQAAAVFSQVRNKLPGEWKTFSFYQEASSWIESGDKTKGLALLEENFNQNPSSETAQLSLFRAGQIYLHDLKDEKKAQEIFNKLAEQVPGSKLWQYINYKVKEDVSANYLQKGFDLLKVFDLLKQSQESSDEQKCVEALDMFNQALEIIPGEALAYSGKALAYYLLNKSGEALKEAERAREIAPDNPENIAILGFIYYNLGMIDKAVSEYKEVANKLTSSIAFYNLATLYVVKGDYDGAQKAFRQAIKIDPKFAEAHNNLGYALWLGEQFQEARDSFERAISLKPDYLDPHYNLGIALYVAGDYEAARKEFLYLEQVSPGYKEVRGYLKKIEEKLGY